MSDFIQGFLEVSKVFVSQTLFEEIPILNIPILKQLVLLLINKILETFVLKTEAGAYFLKVSNQVNEEKSNFVLAIEKHMEIQAHGSEEEKNRAKKELIDRAVSFIRFRE